jgi:hypothetical protein
MAKWRCLPAQRDVDAKYKRLLPFEKLNAKVEVNDVSHNSAGVIVSGKYYRRCFTTHIDPVRKVAKTPIFFLLDSFMSRTTGIGM